MCFVIGCVLPKCENCMKMNRNMGTQEKIVYEIKLYVKHSNAEVAEKKEK